MSTSLQCWAAAPSGPHDQEGEQLMLTNVLLLSDDVGRLSVLNAFLTYDSLNLHWIDGEISPSEVKHLYT